jgi:uridine kinase
VVGAPVRCGTVAITMAHLEVRRFVDLAASIAGLPPSCGPVRLVAVDGPGGAGKTTFATRLAASFDGAAAVQVVHTDDFASWDNQFGWAPRLRAGVIEPLRRGEPGRYQRYDWVEKRFAERHDVAPAPVVVVEGVGAAQSAFTDALAMTVWVDTPSDVRLARGLARDGEHMRDFWEQWIIGERAHFAADVTRRRADLVVAGDPAGWHDAEAEFFALI